MTAFPSDRRPKAQRHATNKPSLPPQRQNLWDIWLGNTQSEFRASPLCLFSSVNISLPLCKKTNYSPPFYCLFKLAWPPRSRPQSIPSSVRARGLKARLVHSFTSQSVCVFVSPPSLKGGGGTHTIWDFWWVSGGTVHVFCDDGGEGGQRRGFGKHAEDDACTTRPAEPRSVRLSEKQASIIQSTRFGKGCICAHARGGRTKRQTAANPAKLWSEGTLAIPTVYRGWMGGGLWLVIFKKTKAHEVVRREKITVMT